MAMIRPTKSPAREKQTVTSKDVGTLKVGPDGKMTVGSPGAAPHIAAAVGVAVRAPDRGLGKAIEAAMSAAIEQAAKDGVTNDDEVRARMQAAREKARAEYKPPTPELGPETAVLKPAPVKGKAGK